MSAVLIPGHSADCFVEDLQGRFAQESEFLARFTANISATAGMIEESHLVAPVVASRCFCQRVGHATGHPLPINKPQQLSSFILNL